MGTLDIPIPSLPERPASGSLSQPSTSFAPPFSGSAPPVQLAHAAESIAKSPESLTAVRRRRFKTLGLSRGTRKILKRQYTSRTTNQYAGAWSRFSTFVRKEKIPRAEISESTVLNYLSSRLRDPAKRGKGKVAPLTLRTELYGLRNPLWAKYGLELDTTSIYSVTKMYISALVSCPSPEVDVFPKWKLKDLLDYLESRVFEPLEEKSLEICRSKALILMMLATGRRLEDIQALESWKMYESNGTRFLRFKAYEGWKGKAVSSKNAWRPKDVIIYPIDDVEDRNLTALCPLRAFRIFWKVSKSRRLAQGSSQRLWLHNSSPSGFLSRVIIKVIKESMKKASPLTPAGGYPKAGTHHLRKFSFSYAYIYGVCDDLQQLWNRAGSKSGVTPIKSYIRNVPEITFYMCSPLGTLQPNMPPLREVSDPVRS